MDNNGSGILHKGMSNYRDQKNDRRKWQLAVQERNKLIKELNRRGIKVQRPHEMKMDDLRALL